MILHNFTGGVGDGQYPYGSLALSGSTLYGMTVEGETSNLGAVFSIGTDGTSFGLLHSFNGDGRFPYGSLTLSGSKLYGMTNQGGSSGKGTLFTMNADGTDYSLLHSFTGSDGGHPDGSLTLSGSKLYGMTQDGGSGGNGSLFSMDADGSGFALLESFGGTPTGGASPIGDLTLSDDASTLYGMTYAGGTLNRGVIFSRSIPAPEPGCFTLLGLGTVLLSARRRNARA